MYDRCQHCQVLGTMAFFLDGDRQTSHVPRRDSKTTGVESFLVRWRSQRAREANLE